MKGICLGRDDYIDADVSYFIGLVIARGTLEDKGSLKQLLIEFPYSNLKVEGITSSFDQDKEIRLGLHDLRERLLDLLDTDIKMVRKQNGVDFIIRFMRNSVAWRNLIAIVGDATTHSYFTLPHVFFRSDIPDDWKREFIRGYADVAGNVRHANRYIDGRHRVRLDVLNYSTNWEMPVQLCTLLQEQLGIPVQLITWGHPNMGRKFREHQINIFIEPFSKIGFSFAHKQTILNEFREYDKTHLKPIEYLPCPGMRKRSKSKPHDPDENNAEKLDDRLLSHHYDAYWQICHSLGCTKTLDLNEQ